jgi:hypothetical protein
VAKNGINGIWDIIILSDGLFYLPEYIKAYSRHDTVVEIMELDMDGYPDQCEVLLLYYYMAYPYLSD